MMNPIVFILDYIYTSQKCKKSDWLHKIGGNAIRTLMKNNCFPSLATKYTVNSTDSLAQVEKNQIHTIKEYIVKPYNNYYLLEATLAKEFNYHEISLCDS